MRLSHNISLIWKRQVFCRHWHEDFTQLLELLGFGAGIYLIGCSDQIVYIGQSCRLDQRPIESLGNIYHRVPDTSLPWSIAIAPCPADEMHERESTAIRAYAPRLNTSIPSIARSQCRMPEVIGVAAVFHNQDGPGGAFDPNNLKRQMELAKANSSPPWKERKRRRKTEKRESQHTEMLATPFEWSDEDTADLLRAYGVPLSEPLRFKINLCKDGSVVTKDGEYTGTWEMDENEHPSFIPTGASEPLFFDIWVGMLCERIRKWHEANTGEAISD